MKRTIFFMILAWFGAACLFGQEKESDTSAIQGTIIVANKSGDNVSIIDATTGNLVREVAVGLEPHEVEVSPNGRLAVVGNFGNRENPGNTLSVIDLRNGRLLRTIDLGTYVRPHGLKWLHGSSRFLVTSGPSNHILEVNASNGRIVRAINTGQETPHMVTITPNNRTIFASSVATGNVSVVDFKTGELIRIVRSGNGAEGIDVSPDGREVWVANRAENTISVFNAESLEKVATLPAGDFPIRGRFTPDGRLFLVSNARAGSVSVFDAASYKKVAEIRMQPPQLVGADDERYFAEFAETSVPIGIHAPNNTVAFVANTRSDVVTRICLLEFKITGHFTAGREPDGVHFSPIRPTGRR